MLLGKRPRHPLKRNTSMTEFSFDDLSILHHHPPPSDQNPDGHVAAVDRDHQMNQTAMGLVSPRLMLHRRNSADMVHPSSSFLRTCSFCSRRLAPGRDIFMYRGDSAFCSLECRQQQITQDEWREKSTVLSSSNKESNSSSSHTAGSTVSSTKAETLVAL